MASRGSPRSRSVPSSASDEELIRAVGESLDDNTVPQWLHNNRQLHELERDRVFGRAWIFVGHESEIPEPGDYARRHVAGDPYIFTRGEDGEVNVLFNSCRHKGTEVCRADQGNSHHFRCPYHGWTYNNKGDLVGLPFQHLGYQGLDKSEWGLIPAARTSSVDGFYFASLAEDGPSLADWIGDFRWYWDVHMKPFDGGWEVVGDPHRWRLDVDWKTGAENFGGDPYHTQFVHGSVFDIGLMGAADQPKIDDRYRFLRLAITKNGQSFMFIGPPDASPYLGHGPELADTENLDDEQAEIFRRSITHTLTVFPDFSLIHFAARSDTTSEPIGGMSARRWRPLGPGRIELVSWILVPANAPDDHKERSYQAVMSAFAPAGNFEQDDVSVWPTIAEAADTVTARKRNAQLNYTAGSYLDEEEPIPDDLDHEAWPGEVTGQTVSDLAMKNIYDRWYELMLEGERDDG